MKKKFLWGFFFAVIAAFIFSISYFIIEEQSMLFGLKIISSENMSSLDINESSPTDNQVNVLFNGKAIPYDKYNNTYYLYQPTKNGFSGNLEPENDSYRLFICDSENDLYFVFLKNGVYTKSELVVTTIPVLEINVYNPDGTPIKDGIDTAIELKEEPYVGEYKLFSDIESSKASKMYQEGFLNLSLRGRLSSSFVKHGYRIELFNKNGEKKNESFLGMRSDDDWILNPLYSDQSMIREKVAYQIWKMMDEADGSFEEPSSRIEYVELIVNNGYQGLFGLQERIDEKQLNLDKDCDVLYKCRSWGIPSKEAFDIHVNDDVCEGWEIIYSPTDLSGKKWSYIRSFIDSYLRGSENSTISWDNVEENINLNNFVDYYIFKQVLRCIDNSYNNSFYLFDVSDGGVMYQIPWDLNYVLGDTYENGAKFATSHVPMWYNQEPLQDVAFDVLMTKYPDKMIPILKERWDLMSNSVFFRKNINTLIQGNYNYLYESGAYNRNSERWSDCLVENASIIEDEFLMSIENFNNYVHLM